MNILQSFMGCMYPGTIRTESIESMGQDYPECRYQVANVDETGNEVSRGELQLTDQDLIYFRPSRFPTRWPIGFIRRYGQWEEKNIFIFESGRRCQTGEAIFAFRLTRVEDLVEQLRDRIERLSSSQDNREQDQHDILSNCRSNRVDAPTRGDRSTVASIEHNYRFNAQPDSHAQKKKSVATSTDDQDINNAPNEELSADPRPLSYALIDFDTTKALTESAQAHAASRVR